MLGRRFAWVSLCLAAALLTGCGQEELPVGGQPLSDPYREFVSLSPSSTEIVIASLGYGNKIVGRTASCDFPTTVTTAPVVLKGLTPNYEEIKKLAPDCVVYDSSLYSEAVIQKVKDLGIPTFDTRAENLKSLESRIMELAALSGNEVSGSDYIDRIYSMIANRKALAPSPAPSVAILLPGQGGEHMQFGQESFLAEMVTLSGGTPVGIPGNQFASLNPEAFVRSNPDVIIVNGDAAPILRDPRLKSMKAVRNGNVFGFKDSGILLRAGGRVDKLIENISALLVKSKR